MSVAKTEWKPRRLDELGVTGVREVSDLNGSSLSLDLGSMGDEQAASRLADSWFEALCLGLEG